MKTQIQTNEAAEALIAHRIVDLDVHPDSNEEIMELNKSRQLLRAAPAMLEALREIKSLSESSIGNGFPIDPAVFRDIAGNAIAAAENLPKGN